MFPAILKNRAAFAAILGIALLWTASPRAAAADVPPAPVSKPTPSKDLEQSRAFEIFRRDIEPLLTREVADESCASCHEQGGTSQLVLPGNVFEDFNALLNGGYLFRDGPDTLLARLLEQSPKKRMPKGRHAVRWTDDEIGKVKTFLDALGEVLKLDGRSDEQFPAALLSPYTGPKPASLDNQFLTYRQLRGKVSTIFHDDWVRNGESLFEKNLALFGGADFQNRFNETSKASASFLTGLEMLSRDVSDRAYTMKVGPFEGWPASLPSPDMDAESDATYRRQIAQLWRAILFRDPSDAEAKQAYELIRGVWRAKEEIQGTDFDLAFALIVEDPATGLKSERTITLPVSGEFHGLYQELIDQSQTDASNAVARHTLTQKFHFKKGDTGQRFRLGNVNTFGNVSLSGIELRKAGADKVTPIPVTGAEVQAEGAWKISSGDGLTSYEDGNVEKGTSNIVIPIKVAEDGEYELAVLWRAGERNAHNVLVEVFSQAGNSLAIEPAPKAPAHGSARFHYDSSADNIPYVELPAVFRFADADLVEISNAGTHDRVTASALSFIPQKGGEGFFFDSKEADGSGKWQTFDSGRFKAYNKVGTPLHDGGKDKGELFLRFKPSAKTVAWNPETFYRVQVNFPGKAGNELRVPVTVHARESSPIIQVVHPARARAESAVVIDASGSYTVQGSQLTYHWKQIDGPAVKIDSTGPVLRFDAPRRDLQQAAWVALCRALLRHPDFVFTRPPSMEFAQNPEEKRRLQLVKIALDLVGRPPTSSELADLANGASLEKMVDRYLDTQEFKDFYFHRIRLHLESHGTESQDEPARLWCHVAFHDLPVQQILTADYTVDEKFNKQPRPAYHGRTGVLTTGGFIEGKPGLPHYNYAAQVAMLFLGYVFEVPPEVVEQREGSTAASTVDPGGICYSCHKVLTPLAMQRNFWSDDGRFRTHDEFGLPIDASDGKLVDGYPFAGEGLEAFAMQAVKKERFFRTLIDTHVTFFFGRQMRWLEDERVLYQRVWQKMQQEHYTVRSIIRTLMTSPEYLEGKPPATPAVTASADVQAETGSPTPNQP